MAKKSAGILLCRIKNKFLEIILVHPGGPFWLKKDLGAWSISKGEFTENENPLDAVKREFQTELGIYCAGNFIPLTSIKQKNGKVVYVWALKSEIDHIKLKVIPLKWSGLLNLGENKNSPKLIKEDGIEFWKQSRK